MDETSWITRRLQIELESILFDVPWRSTKESADCSKGKFIEEHLRGGNDVVDNKAKYIG